MKIKFKSIIKEGSGRMDDVVYAKWRGVQYVKNYTAPKGEPTERQKQVAAAFTALVSIWKTLPAVMHRAWHELTKDENLTGYNAFIGANITRYRTGELLNLAHGLGEEPLAGMTAAPGANPGELRVQAAGMRSGAHLTVFTHRLEEGRAAGPVAMHPAGAASALTVQGLDPGSAYHVYALATDAPYADAKTCSSSIAAEAKAA